MVASLSVLSQQSGRRFASTTSMSNANNSVPTVPSQVRAMSTATDQDISNPAMFCRQCEQTQDHVACRTVGICGKTAETSSLQDTLIHTVKSISLWCVAAREAGATAEEMYDANWWTLRSTFSTLTNVNFDEERIAEFVQEGQRIKRDLEALIDKKGGKAPTGDVANVDLSNMTVAEMEDFGYTVSIPNLKEAMGNDDCFSLVEIGTYGSKGVCAYAAHCHQLGSMDEDVMSGIHEVFAKLASNEADMNGLLANVLRVGELNGKVLAMLDEAHASNFGAPEPTQVKVTATEGKCILVSGHDLVDLAELLKQTEGTGINVYTHGEMLPAHSYPGLKKYPHLVGNYGTAWQNQKFEFAGFPGPIIVTTNCIVEPRRMYKDRIYSINEVGVAGVKHLPNRDFSQVIEQAQSCKGFAKTIEPAEHHLVGFNHRAVLPLAGDVIDAVQKGIISRIFLIGGCDGSQFDRNYFTELAEELPDDTLILTLGCAKNRFIHSKKLLDQTLANGMPRIMDMGQCNDSYSAIVVATELAKALDCSVNELPLSLCLSHLEQKAAAVLLTLLQMGVKNIRLGPSLPAYITPNVLGVLVENYNLMPTGEVHEDIKNMMAGQ
jgi:hydroxylamine reductase